MTREHSTLFTLISTHTGNRYTVELWQDYGVVLPVLCTTNGSCGTAAQFCFGHVRAGNYTVEPGTITPDMSSEQALKDQLVKLARGG